MKIPILVIAGILLFVSRLCIFHQDQGVLTCLW
jgi:hypothetical protein